LWDLHMFMMWMWFLSEYGHCTFNIPNFCLPLLGSDCDFGYKHDILLFWNVKITAVILGRLKKRNTRLNSWFSFCVERFVIAVSLSSIFEHNQFLCYFIGTKTERVCLPRKKVILRRPWPVIREK
jgi:hypothetical protein